MRKASLREIYRCTVLDPDGRELGTVIDVLFHPREARAVGYSVRKSLASGIVPLPTQYLALDKTSLTPDGVLAVMVKKSAWGGSAARAHGFDWESTVIWYGQHVETVSGEHLGKVSDCLFSVEDGSAGNLQVTGGTTADATLGKRTVRSEFVVGFDLERHCILVEDEASTAQFVGGAAQVAGRVVGEAASTASVYGEKAAKSAVVAAATATVYTQQAVKRAAQSETGRKAKRWLTSIVDDVKEAMGDDDDN